MNNPRGRERARQSKDRKKILPEYKVTERDSVNAFSLNCAAVCLFILNFTFFVSLNVNQSDCYQRWIKCRMTDQPQPDASMELPYTTVL